MAFATIGIQIVINEMNDRIIISRGLNVPGVLLSFSETLVQSKNQILTILECCFLVILFNPVVMELPQLIRVTVWDIPFLSETKKISFCGILAMSLVGNVDNMLTTCQ